MSSKLHQLHQLWRPLANYAVKAGVVRLQVKLCDPHLSALFRVYTSATCCAATSCADKQLVAGNKLLVARNMLLDARNK